MKKILRPLMKKKISKSENIFKMKLMLEQGAQFGTMDPGHKLPVTIENDFLNI